MSMSAAARFRYTLVAGATAVVIGTGFTAIGLSRHAEAETVVPSAADAPLSVLSESPAPSEAVLLDVTTSPSAPASPTPSPAKASPTPRKTSPSPKRTTTAAKKTAAAVPSTGDAILDAVLGHINDARTGAGLSVLTLDAQLSKASALHTELMINGCGLEHQCPGESGIGDRFSAQGVSWTSAGENIGFGSSGASDAQIVKAANGLTDSMLAEVPPNDGHRKNLLSTSFKRIGLSIVRDGKGVTWMTQDFVN